VTLSVTDIVARIFGGTFAFPDWRCSQGEVIVGAGLNGVPVRLVPDDLLGNCLVVGRPGSWKTTLLANLRRQLREWEIRSLWLDVYKRDGRHEPGVRVYRVAKGELKLNPLQLGPQLFSDLFDEAFQLPQASRSSAHLSRWVREVLDKKPMANLFDLRCYLDGLRLAHRSYEDEARDVVLSRLNMLLGGDEGRCFDCAHYPPAALLEHDIVVELPPSQPRASFIAQALQWSVIEDRVRGPRVHGLSHAVFVDEAKTIFSAATKASRHTGHLEMLTAAINVCREYGLAFLWADQSVDAIHPALIESSAVKILLPSSGDVIQRLAKSMEISTPERTELALRLEKGLALMKCGSQPTVVVKLAEFVYEKNVTDPELDASFQPLPYTPANYDEWKQENGEGEGGYPRLRARFWSLYSKTGGILNMSEAATRLRISASEMSKLAARLEEEGHVEKRLFLSKQKLLEITPAGARWCAEGGWFVERKGRGGVIHRRHQYIVGRAMLRRGAKVRLEKEHFDLLVQANGRRVGYEIIVDTWGPDVTVHLRRAEMVDEMVFVFESKREMAAFSKALPPEAANVRAVLAADFYRAEGIRPFIGNGGQ
jgi:hypothetical protein